MREIPRLAVSGATVFDGTGRPPIENATVLIEGDRVVSVGSAATTPIPRGATIIDGKGKFVTPGLVDMHVHVYTPEKWHPEFFLAAGVTTVLDLGGQPHASGVLAGRAGEAEPLRVWRLALAVARRSRSALRRGSPALRRLDRDRYGSRSDPGSLCRAPGCPRRRCRRHVDG